MARAFDDASSQYLEHAGAVVSSYPFTIACWAYFDDYTSGHNLVTLGHSSDTLDLVLLFYGFSGDSVRFRVRNDDTIKESTQTKPAINTWAHIAGTMSQYSRFCYVNGSPGVEETTSVVIPTLDRTCIGTQISGGALSNYHSGMVAEVGFWNIELTQAEIQTLSEGYSPLLVRPENLVAYYPLIRDTDDDIVGGYSMTPVNSPTVAAHPRVFYPGMPHVGYAAAAIAALRIPRHPAAYFGGPTIF